MSELTIRKIVSALEGRAPSGTAENWDNVGLLAGDARWKTRGAVVTIDLTQEALALARRRGFKLIVTHHPSIFPKSKGWSRFVRDENDDALGSVLHDCVREGIAVVACHTNFDRCALEVVERVSSGLGAVPRGRLLERPSGSLLKLVVFVPKTHVELVTDALGAAGAGHIGNYDECTFKTEGEGTFRGLDGAKPFIGKAGTRERVTEFRLETIFPRGLEKNILSALFSSHPYEEVAYDLYPVEQRPALVGLCKGLGYGFWGEFPKAKYFSDVVQSVSSLFKLNGFWVTNPTPSRVRRIAFVAGKGSDFIEAARSVGCELFVTGEAGYHASLDGARRGMAIMELGHRESERFFLETMAEWLVADGLCVATTRRPTQKLWLGGMK